MGHKTIYHLRLELADIKGRSIGNTFGLRMAKAKNGILREILIPGEARLSELHAVIQNIFGWGNLHLHKFSLNEQDFDYLTERLPGIYYRLCGALFRYEGIKSFDWCRYILCERPMYDMPPVTGRCTAYESLYVNQKKAARADIRNCHMKKSRYFTPLDKYHSMEANTLLERLRLDELLNMPNERVYYTLTKSIIFPWRDQIMREVQEKLADIDLFKENDPEGFNKAYGALRELESWKRSFASFLAVHRDPDEVTKRFGLSAEETYKLHLSRMLECLDDAGKLIKGHDPGLTPVFDSINYWYDKGDEWCVIIKCLNIFHPVSGTIKGDVPQYDIPSMLRENDGHTEDMPRILPDRDNKSDRYYAGNGTEWTDGHGLTVNTDAARALSKVSEDSDPVCIAADGLNVFDDVGGVKGYFEFLKVMNGPDKREALRVREIADIYGWTGGKPGITDVGF